MVKNVAQEFSNVLVIIPSLSPDEKMIRLIQDLKGGGFPHILIINDGSTAEYDSFFRRAEEDYGCEVLRHYVNFGKGRALKTAFNHFLTAYPDCVGVVTVDSDGQHKLEDIQACCREMLAHPEALVLGSRNFAQSDVPFRSRYGNVITRQVFRLLCGVKISDTQTGLRALSAPLAKRFLTTKGERFEYEMNMLIDCSEEKIPLREVPIQTVYIEENASSHFHVLRDSIKIYAVFAKFLFSSVSSFVVDILMFTMFGWVIHLAVPEWDSIAITSVLSLSTLAATVAARVISSLRNYLLNWKLVFQSRGNGVTALLKYYLLAIVVMILSAFGVGALSSLTSIHKSIVKIPVDMVLFLISFPIQKHWVFPRKSSVQEESSEG